jgi:uncharacterized protein
MRRLLGQVLADYELDPAGIHGVLHWGRVLENGRRLCEANGASPRVIELFALLHDSRRENDGSDPAHGPRASEYAESLNGVYFDLDKRELRQLATACETHTFGTEHRDLTVKTCWDADRLDLGRLGIVPDPARLTTDAGRQEELIDWPTSVDSVVTSRPSSSTSGATTRQISDLRPGELSVSLGSRERERCATARRYG